MRGLGALALVAVLGLPLVAHGAGPGDETAAELQIKAVFLYKFGSFVEWPPHAFDRSDDALVIGVMGANEMAEELAQVVMGRTILGRTIAVKRVRPGDPIAGLHILFVGRSNRSALGEVLAAAKGKPILTVTDAEGASELGSMINFVLDGTRVRFDVAPVPAEQGSLRISARLLAIARKVVGKPS